MLERQSAQQELKRCSVFTTYPSGLASHCHRRGPREWPALSLPLLGASPGENRLLVSLSYGTSTITNHQQAC
eukprot:1134489-Pelagomonas_calceolata.AAC.7